MVDLEDLYTRHYTKLVGVALRISSSLSDAEDAVHDVFVSLLDKQPEEASLSYLCYQVRFAVYNSWRKHYGTHADKSRAATLVPVEEAAEVESGDDVAWHAISRMYLQSAVELCPIIPRLVGPDSTAGLRTNNYPRVRRVLGGNLDSYIRDKYFDGQSGRQYPGLHQCVGCGHKFSANKPGQRFCSGAECRRQRANAKNREQYARRAA